MPSPFPGMDPYLEGYLWPDVHQSLASEIRDQLSPHLRPKYVARLAITTIRDESPEAEIGIMYPDVEILTTGRVREPSPSIVLTEEKTPVITQPITVPLPNFQVRVVTVEVRDVAQNKLITSIEILSPINKREPGLAAHREKQRQLQDSGVHLLEIDLLRRGKRPLALPFTPPSPYLVTLIRAKKNQAEIWPIHLEDKLPVVAVPLWEPDPDVPLDLSLALKAIYDKAAYDLSIDYNQSPPPPPLTAEEEAWLKETIGEYFHHQGNQA